MRTVMTAVLCRFCFRAKNSLSALFAVAAICAVMTLAFPQPAHAFSDEELRNVTEQLNDKSSTKKLAAIEAMAADGDPRVAPILNAMLEGNLFVRASDEHVVIGEKKGKVWSHIDVVSGEVVGESGSGELDKIKINNRLRGALRDALAALNLFSQDIGIRTAAVEQVMDARDPSMLPLLIRAIEREEDATLLARMELARATMALAAGETTEERLTAIEVLASETTPQIRAVLSQFVASAEAEGYQPEVVAAAKDALADVEGRLSMWQTLGDVYRGISLGSVLLLAAVGLAITFGVMGVINMAHGEMIMIGAYTTFVVQQIFSSVFPSGSPWSLVIAVPAAFVVAGLVGIVIERCVIRFLYGRPLETLLATWGVSLVLQQAIRSIFGATNQQVTAPDFMSGALELSSGLVLTYNRLWIILFSLIVVGGIAIVLRYTAFGLQMRAVTQNRRMAGSVGIRTGYVDALTFGLGSGIAGIAGVALSQISNVSPNLGQTYIIDSFMVVVFGGVGNLWGTVLGAFSLGIVNKFLEPAAGAVLAKIFVLIALILFIQKRPKGLFALKGRAVEA
ncbi:amino acid/amide ABC transporter membrane protein 1, HAAT family [Thalassospira xiamenensis M-5 = DSM 17429]|uniref:Inner-membrane translocator n=1 Tax=Thalassospira xiamenensis M-5 = DSM 17429 TaxID=1123366 RepID=A0AB72UHT1_9PROT|nr:urea ABC transporter permease subunit UrtB [Thalassospira xiamenensis]AJD53760.1 inner-membrane translocator [Thalassospira xiamenensis M-5 = DSM 17429]SIS53358.1 amino acid/amide ABC transporter membrane protein 1, HAAT family [Thalassospira xiamenensis M-5 = DSM 17429]